MQPTALAHAIQNLNESVRSGAARALGRIEPAVEPAVPALIDMIKASTPSSTNEIGVALQALTSIDPETAVAIIEAHRVALRL